MVASEELALAGSVSGALYLVGGVTLVPLMFIPGISHDHRIALVSLTLIACAWGASSIWLINWDKAPRLLIHASASIGLIIIAVAIGLVIDRRSLPLADRPN